MKIKNMTYENKIEYLDLGLRMLGLTFDNKTHKKIIMLRELLDKKGGETNINDIESIKHRL